MPRLLEKETMSEPLIHDPNRPARELATRFRAMADKIELNDDSAFGGAFVIIPPANGGDPVETLILDGRQDPSQFWSILKTKCDIMLASLDEQARQQQAFRR